MKPSFTYEATLTASPTLVDLAHMVAHLQEKDQQTFIELLYESWPESRRLMERIGAYVLLSAKERELLRAGLYSQAAAQRGGTNG